MTADKSPFSSNNWFQGKWNFFAYEINDCCLRSFSSSNWICNWSSLNLCISLTAFDSWKSHQFSMYERSAVVPTFQRSSSYDRWCFSFYTSFSHSPRLFVSLRLLAWKSSSVASKLQFPLKWKVVKRGKLTRDDDIRAMAKFSLYVGCFNSSSWWLLPVLTTQTIDRAKKRTKESYWGEIERKKELQKKKFSFVSLFAVRSLFLEKQIKNISGDTSHSLSSHRIETRKERRKRYNIDY